MKTRTVILLTLSSLLLLLFTCNDKKKEPTIEELVIKMNQEGGGLEKFNAVKDQTSTWKITSFDSSGTSESHLAVVFKRPNMLRYDNTTLEGDTVFTMATDGTIGWIDVPGYGQFDMPSGKLNETISLAEHWVDEWANYKNIGLKLSLVVEKELKDHYTVQSEDRFGNKTRYLVNKTNFTIERVEGMTHDYFSEAAFPSVQKYENHKKINGITFPATIIDLDSIGNTLSQMELVKMQNNLDISDSLFSNPS